MRAFLRVKPGLMDRLAGAQLTNNELFLNTPDAIPTLQLTPLQQS